MIRTIHKARFVLAEPDLVLHDAAIHVCDPGRICRIEPWRGRKPDPGTSFVDWGSSIVIPGLVNAHTHLELTRLHKAVDFKGTFTDWLAQIIQLRRPWTQKDYEDSTREGARLALTSGTTLIGDISSSGLARRALSTEPLRKVVFEEVLALAPEGAQQALSILESRMPKGEEDPLTTCGASPHAPYSVSPQLYRGVAMLARKEKVPIATHLAETKAEAEFLVSGTGEFRDFLSKIGVLPPGWTPPGLPPVPYLDSLNLLEASPLLIHCNYLDAAAIALVLDRRCSVVYCPRSHSFFGHDQHPVRLLLDAGVNVALGTDSLASNESLSMLEEMRFLSKIRKDLKGHEVFRMATVNGAAALGFGGVLGRLRRGYWADLSVVHMPASANPKYLLNQVLDGAGECIATIVRGNVAWQSPNVAGAGIESHLPPRQFHDRSGD